MEIVRLEPGSPHIAQLGAHFAREWPDWARTQVPAQMATMFTSGPQGRLPVVLAAVEDGLAIGTVALRQWFGSEPMAETPWIRGFWVLPERRRQGIGGALLAAVERAAWNMAIRRVHAATTGIEAVLSHHGYKVFHRFEHEGQPMAWMRKDLGPPKAHREP